MLILYFSGTGNTEKLAQFFSETVIASCHSIEESVDFKSLIEKEDIVAFCYPIYGSCVPAIMRNFVSNNKQYLQGKKIIIFCSQAFFSGDGARVFTELLVDIQIDILYAEHFNMSNNICNLWFLPISSEQKEIKMLKKTKKKLLKVCKNIELGIVIKRGFNSFSKNLGWYSQRIYFGKVEEKARRDIRINYDCNLCGLCVRICPTKNLVFSDRKITSLGTCTLCYRCVNACPKKAITVLVHSKVIKQKKLFVKHIDIL